MWILPLIGYLGLILGFSFLTLAIASGLYYLSELVEEHTRLTHLILTRLIYILLALHLLLYLVDSFPLYLTALSITSHLLYSLNLRRFPTVNLLSPIFLLSCVLVLVNHYAYFRHFSNTPSRPRTPLPIATRDGRRMAAYAHAAYGDLMEPPSFTEVAAFFGVMIWLVPFALFVSLSAGDNVLPTMGSEGVMGVRDRGETATGAVSGGRSGGGGGMAKQVVDRVREAVGGWTGWGGIHEAGRAGSGIGLVSGGGSSGGYGADRTY